MLLPALGYAVLTALGAGLAVVLFMLLRRSTRLHAQASETEARLAVLADRVEQASSALRQAALDATPPPAAPPAPAPPADESAAPRRRRRRLRPAPARP